MIALLSHFIFKNGPFSKNCRKLRAHKLQLNINIATLFQIYETKKFNVTPILNNWKQGNHASKYLNMPVKV